MNTYGIEIPAEVKNKILSFVQQGKEIIQLPIIRSWTTNGLEQDLAVQFAQERGLQVWQGGQPVRLG